MHLLCMVFEIIRVSNQDCGLCQPDWIDAISMSGVGVFIILSNSDVCSLSVTYHLCSLASQSIYMYTPNTAGPQDYTTYVCVYMLEWVWQLSIYIARFPWADPTENRLSYFYLRAKQTLSVDTASSCACVALFKICR